MLYRSHAAELLDRLASGEDTRPATTAEMIAALMETALRAPLTPSAFCLTMRLFLRAFPETALSLFAGTDVLDPAAYETVHGARADEHEAELRRKLTQNSRSPNTAGPTTSPITPAAGVSCRADAHPPARTAGLPAPARPGRRRPAADRLGESRSR